MEGEKELKGAIRKLLIQSRVNGGLDYSHLREFKRSGWIENIFGSGADGTC